MLQAHIDHPDNYRPLLTHPVWEKVFAWIGARDPDLPDGIHPIEGDDIYVNQHRYETLPRARCRWESHRRYLDLQFCLEGREIIDVTRRDDLEPDGSYDAEADLLFHRTPFQSAPTIVPGSVLPVLMSPGTFTVFTPSDAHRPKVMADRPSPVRKFVVKILRDRLEKG